MEHIMKFNLPEDKQELILAQKGNEYWLALWNLIYGSEGVRNKLKHGHKFKDADEALEWVRDFVVDNVDLDEIE
jgi:hypothetical protein